MSQKILFLALSILSLVGCSVAVPEFSYFIPQRTARSIQQNMAEAQVSCDEGNKNGGCSESTGYILTTSVKPGETGVFQCTGWVLGPDLIATNSHCIPDELKKAGSDCSGRMGIKFPRMNGREVETRFCKQIVFASQLSGSEGPSMDHPDYAIFKLSESTQRPPIPLSREGLIEDQSYILESVDPQSKFEAVGKLTRRKCVLKRGAQPVPNDVDELSPISTVFGPDCNARQGNSGSAVLNSRGQAVAVLFAGMVDLDAYKKLNRVEFEPSTPYLPVYLTNFACLPKVDPVSAFGQPDEVNCQPEARELKIAEVKDSRTRAFQAAVAKEVEAVAKVWLKTAPPGVRFRFDFTKSIMGAYVLEAIPVCLLRERSLEPRTAFSQPRFELRSNLDEYFRLQLKVAEVKRSHSDDRLPQFISIHNFCGESEPLAAQ